MKGIEVRDLTVRFSDRVALDSLSFKLESSFFALLMGPNGAGKSTLLKTLVGILKPSEGSVRVYGLDPSVSKGRVSQLVGYVPQVTNVRYDVPVTVEEVVAMGLLAKTPPPRILSRRVREAVLEALKAVAMESKATEYFSDLSGGEQQRVLIARAIVRKPKILILDEPYSMLDFKVKCEIVDTIYKFHVGLGVDVFMAAHEPSACLRYEPTILLLNRKLYGVGPAREVLRIENLRKAYPGLTHLRGIVILGEDHGH